MFAPDPPLYRIARQAPVTQRDRDGKVIVAVSGEIDLVSSSMLERELERAERSLPTCIVLDLRRLQFIDSSGIHVLWRARERALASGREILRTNIPAHAARLFRIVGLDGWSEGALTASREY